MSRRILILFAHPSIHLSEVNRVLAKDMTALEGVTLIDLYAEYPTLQIDVVREQQRLLEHDAVVFMFPLYWYSTPAILKEWQDLVLEYGFAYGHDGTALVGKIFTCMLTAGGTEDGYADTGYNHYSLRELLRPLEQTANLCGMRYLPPLALFGARTAREEHRISAHSKECARVLQALSQDSLDLEACSELEVLNEDLDKLLGAPS